MVAPFRHATAANCLGREFVNASQFNEIAVTDRTTLEGLTCLSRVRMLDAYVAHRSRPPHSDDDGPCPQCARQARSWAAQSSAPSSRGTDSPGSGERIKPHYVFPLGIDRIVPAGAFNRLGRPVVSLRMPTFSNRLTADVLSDGGTFMQRIGNDPPVVRTPRQRYVLRPSLLP
jgi:hypothetical protein